MLKAIMKLLTKFVPFSHEDAINYVKLYFASTGTTNVTICFVKRAHEYKGEYVLHVDFLLPDQYGDCQYTFTVWQLDNGELYGEW